MIDIGVHLWWSNGSNWVPSDRSSTGFFSRHNDFYLQQQQGRR